MSDTTTNTAMTADQIRDAFRNANAVKTNLQSEYAKLTEERREYNATMREKLDSLEAQYKDLFGVNMPPVKSGKKEE